jgi:hypothetical protein
LGSNAQNLLSKNNALHCVKPHNSKILREEGINGN